MVRETGSSFGESVTLDVGENHIATEDALDQTVPIDDEPIFC